MKPENLENTVFAIVLDFTKPWEFMDQLSQWSDVIFDINKKLFLQLPVVKQNAMRKKIENHFKFYKNPDKSKQAEDATEEAKVTVKEGEGEEEEMREALNEMELEEGVLNVNLGVHLMVICAKAEVIATGETQKYFNHRFEFIQKHLREFTLRYGASLIFTSAKKGTNLELFHSYLKHIFFDADFNSGPEVNNKESIFIPSGYDSPKFVKQLAPSVDDPYDKIVSNISVGDEVTEEEEIKWEDWDSWLESIKDNFPEDEQNEDSKQDSIKTEPTKKEDLEEKVMAKKTNPKGFFQNLIKAKPRDSVKKTPNEPNADDFKSKLRLDNIDD